MKVINYGLSNKIKKVNFNDDNWGLERIIPNSINSINCQSYYILSSKKDLEIYTLQVNIGSAGRGKPVKKRKNKYQINIKNEKKQNN